VTGKLHHVPLAADQFDEKSFKDGFPKLDGSSIRGFGVIEESDFRLRPVPETAVQTPWGTTMMLSEVHEGGGRGRFERDPRHIAERTEAYMREMGFKCYFGPELEFFVVKRVDGDFAIPERGTGFQIHTDEAPWDSTGSNMIARNDGYYTDKAERLRLQIASTLKEVFQFPIIATHHEVALAQWEITSVFGELVEMADRTQTIKWVVKRIAAENDMEARFIPKLIFGQNASGMHVHFSLWTPNGETNLMFQAGTEAELSETGRYAIGGLLKHAKAIAAFSNPTTNSYRRLIPGFEAPVNIAWGQANRSAVVRIPGYEGDGNPAAKRLEFRQPDPSANPYLLFSAMALAAADGIKNKIDPGPAVNSDIYHMTPEQKKALNISGLPGSLSEALDALESDHDFLKPAFPASLLRTYIDMKREEIQKLQGYPHPIEIYHYSDV
jgi:glutamine synthetase